MNKNLKDYEEILQQIYQHAAVLIETNLVEGLTPTQVIANLASELVLLEQSGTLENYKKDYIDPYLTNEQVNDTMKEIESRLHSISNTKKNSMHRIILFVYSIFNQLSAEFNQTLLIVTHDKEFADKTDKIIEMGDGMIIRQ